MSTCKLLLTSLAMLAGCRESLQKPPVYAKDGDGAAYCRELARTAEREASTWSVLGWTVGAAGAIGVVAGPAMGPDDDGDNWVERNRNVLVTAGGGILVALALSMMSSSDASATASGAATRQLAQAKDGDLGAFKECVATHATWIEQRRDANAILSKELERQRQASEDNKKLAEEMKQRAEVAEELVKSLRP